MKIKLFAAVLALAMGVSLYGASEVKAAPKAAPAVSTAKALPGAGDVKAAPAEAPAEAQENAAANKKKSSGFMDFLPIILIIVVFYFFIFRGNKKQQQKRQEALDRTVKGTRVMLNSGVYGKVVEVKENDFVVEIADNVQVLVNKNGVTPVEEEKPAEKAEKDQDKK